MADQALLLSEVENLFYQVSVAIIGGSRVFDMRISWPREGASAFNILQDVGFLRCVAIDEDVIDQGRDIKFSWNVSPDSLNQETSFIRVWEINWIFYGPNSFEYGQMIRDRITYQEFYDLLVNQNFSLVTQRAEPKRVPENFQGQWWERVDFKMKFNELVKKNWEIQHIRSVGINLSDPVGIKADIVVDEGV